MITRSNRGSETIFQNDRSDIVIDKFDPAPIAEPCDETGCGDTFLMGYTWAFLQTGNRAFASRFANRVAGINVCLRGIEGIGKNKPILNPRRPAYAGHSDRSTCRVKRHSPRS